MLFFSDGLGRHFPATRPNAGAPETPGLQTAATPPTHNQAPPVTLWVTPPPPPAAWSTNPYSLFAKAFWEKTYWNLGGYSQFSLAHQLWTETAIMWTRVTRHIAEACVSQRSLSLRKLKWLTELRLEYWTWPNPKSFVPLIPFATQTLSHSTCSHS